jgi:hypothetical protein
VLFCLQVLNNLFANVAVPCGATTLAAFVAQALRIDYTIGEWKWSARRGVSGTPFFLVNGTPVEGEMMR